MKIGARKVNISKSFKARTTGKIKRNIKSSINPLYGKSGMGYVNDPGRAVYNKIYNKTSFSIWNIPKSSNPIISFFLLIFWFVFAFYYLLIKYIVVVPVKWLINLIKNKKETNIEIQEENNNQ